MISWNNEVKLVLADVDETIADVYLPIDPEMAKELNRLIGDGVKVFLITGGSIAQIDRRIMRFLDPELRQFILVSHCSGSEVWGYDEHGKRLSKPFYSIYEDKFDESLKAKWRNVVKDLISEFDLRTHDVRPKLVFQETVGAHPLDVMMEDRGPQITLEFVNAIDLSDEMVAELDHDIPHTHGQRDLRIPVLMRAEQLFKDAGIPVTPRLGGTMALDFAIEGISKTTSVRFVFEHPNVLKRIGLDPEDITDPESLEVWGDKFSMLRGGTDRHISEALPKKVRSIDFREENPEEFLPDYNTVLWDGTQSLHDGALEYLQSRSS